MCFNFLLVQNIFQCLATLIHVPLKNNVMNLQVLWSCPSLSIINIKFNSPVVCEHSLFPIVLIIMPFTTENISCLSEYVLYKLNKYEFSWCLKYQLYQWSPVDWCYCSVYLCPSWFPAPGSFNCWYREAVMSHYHIMVHSSLLCFLPHIQW